MIDGRTDMNRIICIMIYLSITLVIHAYSIPAVYTVHNIEICFAPTIA